MRLEVAAVFVRFMQAVKRGDFFTLAYNPADAQEAEWTEEITEEARKRGYTLSQPSRMAYNIVIDFTPLPESLPPAGGGD